jgi:hypothetical protein
MRQVAIGQTVALRFGFQSGGLPVDPVDPKVSIFGPIDRLYTQEALTIVEPGSYRFDYPVGGTLGIYSAFADGILDGEQIPASSEQLFEVSSAGKQIPLVTLEETKAYLADMPVIPEDAQLREFVYAASNMVRNFCKREFTPTLKMEFLHVQCADRVYLTGYPVLQLVSLIDTFEKTDIEYKTLIANLGLLILNDSVDDLSIDATYYVGDSSIPPEASLACKKIVSFMLQRWHREGASAESLLSYDYTLNAEWFKTDIEPLISRIRLVRMS